LLYDQKSPGEAEPMMRLAVETYERSLGADHTSTLNARKNLTRPSRNQTSSGKTDGVCSSRRRGRCPGILGGHAHGRIDGKVWGIKFRGFCPALTG
jgi:hypothetical protein